MPSLFMAMVSADHRSSRLTEVYTTTGRKGMPGRNANRMGLTKYTASRQRGGDAAEEAEAPR
jgi:hypothetical protein